ncbi:disease resistance protein RPV1-like [Rosa rugosa]|uniref:disease resistance protein RPV1-like n=1 Tax=Rosa rugosa TaxID=74645 RepID=UPI002B414388|nr:disease resistance protein RPV1-like [Rosa rugosa]XP_062022548.1 disease resistance protein RPV1-like [Rosa rugosa]XP_062022549.1 disease resistance protein RPV1-like [Rosa rugosa]XP_062022550.1 disease resistance protein RPV1-like [Rosa rugosa]XP_062022551.1 disease resistance protein RPV1-like [Rosa rugosa]XP_062022552.1 disease resistance protein RPV1-like [Rosa rugosa]
MSTQRTSASSPPSTPQWKYDVFLSFRGDDTRKAFTDHLYTALKHQGIITFRDDPELQKGEAISPALFAAIEESRFALIVLSQNYASSTWCLNELVRILECMKEREAVLPIFYDVDPSDVRKQTGSFRQAFTNHEERFRSDGEKVRRWRDALTEVASFSGWNSKEWYESKLIRDIVEDICKRLQPTSYSFADNLVGIDSRLHRVNLHLSVGVDDVRFIGIWGMGGVGKTTMVRAVHERISHEFEFNFLLTDVRSSSIEKGGLLNLQKQLLSGIGAKKAGIFDLQEGATILKRLLRHKKVLLILDDVNHSSHLKYLAGNQEWFGSGSRVLITTRNEHLLIQHGVERRLKVEELNHDDSLKLFSWKAFQKGYPEEDFHDLSESVINYAKGLPLALEVLGSFLYGRYPSEWNSALRKLGRVCNLEIFDILKISYDGLDSEEKKIFLDIACFFNGGDKDRVTEVLNSCDFSAIIGINVLTERSLLTVSHGRLIMHDLLQEMGWEIVRQESHNELGRCSRLWLLEDVKHVLTKNTGTEAVEGIFVDSTESGVDMEVTPKSFSMMNKLRYLKIENGNLPRGLEYLPNSLRILDWTRYPSNSLPSHFNPQKLLELSLCHSCIKHVRIGTEPLCNLKTINLSHSLNLVSTPNFKGIPYLKFLYLEGCIRLYEVDPTIEVLEKLTVLNLKDCKNLVHFASSVHGLKYLKVLNLSGCSKLKKLPNDMGHLESLEELHVNDTGIRELPSSIGMLERLPLLKIENCKDLMCLPISLGGLKSLKVFIISGCSKLEKLPEELGNSLVNVDVSGTSIKELPCSIGMLEGLVSMSLRDCKHLECLPSSVGGLKSLKDLTLSGCSKLEKLPDELGHVACLEKLDVSGSGIRELPSSIGLLKNLKEFSLAGCKARSPKSWDMMFNPFQLLRKRSHIPAGLSLPCLSGLHSLTKLNLSDCNLSEEALPSDFGCLSSLRDLNLSRNQFSRLPESIGQLSRLDYLHLEWCQKLRRLPELPSHVRVDAENCISLDTLANQSNSLRRGYFVNCFKLLENQSCESIALSLLTRCLKSQAFSDHKVFEFVCPGNEIPEWYNHQSVGSSITVELHPGWVSNKWMGFAFCVVFRLLKPLPPGVVWCINCEMSANGKSLSHRSIMVFGGRWGQPVLDHIWFFYRARDMFSRHEWQDIYCQPVFSFRPQYWDKRIKIEEFVRVKKCGVRMIYEEDAEELSETLLKQSNIGINTKQCLQHNDDDEASSSASQAHPKRIKQTPH